MSTEVIVLVVLGGVALAVAVVLPWYGIAVELERLRRERERFQRDYDQHTHWADGPTSPPREDR